MAAPGASRRIISRLRSKSGGRWRQALREATPFLASECPLTGMHILQGMELLAKDEKLPQRSLHPIELIARAYGIGPREDAGAAEPQTRTVNESTADARSATVDAG